MTAVLPGYMVPGAYVRLPALPLTPNGKLDDKALPAPDRDAEAALGAGARKVALTTPLQQQLGAIWREVLGLGEVGAEDDLLALGADFIHIFQIAARASRAGIPAAAKDMLRYRTIDALSAALETPQAVPQAQGTQGPGNSRPRDSRPRSPAQGMTGQGMTGGLPKLSQFRPYRAGTGAIMSMAGMPVMHPAEAPVAVFPCTVGQRETWARDRARPGDPTLNIAARWRLEGPVLPPCWNKPCRP